MSIYIIYSIANSNLTMKLHSKIKFDESSFYLKYDIN
ncbi:hypothetical protein J2Z76_001009 [Sedimentibacter acidaminivorans]|uniref:Uncharacterized protein n=1 Tax=Sedimentibacter acidaminivorans TaxID=913099 RepID=A0ABS4GCA3_9FIRM|nr:hypothetical protein [Sedimentibacter acidaminivorans]